jgi:hypothetical protein
MMIGVVEAEPNNPIPGIDMPQATPSVLTLPELIEESVVVRVFE